MGKRKKMTWWDLAVVRVGFKDATRTLDFLTSWAFQWASEGAPPRNMEAFAAFWDVSIPTAYRNQQLWRRAFPEFKTPTVMLEATGHDPVEAVGALFDEAPSGQARLAW